MRPDSTVNKTNKTKTKHLFLQVRGRGVGTLTTESKNKQKQNKNLPKTNEPTKIVAGLSVFILHQIVQNKLDRCVIHWNGCNALLEVLWFTMRCFICVHRSCNQVGPNSTQEFPHHWPETVLETAGNPKLGVICCCFRYTYLLYVCIFLYLLLLQTTMKNR